MTHFHIPVYMNASFKLGNTHHPMLKQPSLQEYKNIFRRELGTGLITPGWGKKIFAHRHMQKVAKVVPFEKGIAQ